MEKVDWGGGTTKKQVSTAHDGDDPVATYRAMIEGMRNSPQASENVKKAIELLEAEVPVTRAAIPPALVGRFDSALARTLANIKSRADQAITAEFKSACLADSMLGVGHSVFVLRFRSLPTEAAQADVAAAQHAELKAGFEKAVADRGAEFDFYVKSIVTGVGMCFSTDPNDVFHPNFGKVLTDAQRIQLQKLLNDLLGRVRKQIAATGTSDELSERLKPIQESGRGVSLEIAGLFGEHDYLSPEVKSKLAERQRNLRALQEATRNDLLRCSDVESAAVLNRMKEEQQRRAEEFHRRAMQNAQPFAPRPVPKPPQGPEA